MVLQMVRVWLASLVILILGTWFDTIFKIAGATHLHLHLHLHPLILKTMMGTVLSRAVESMLFPNDTCASCDHCMVTSVLHI